MSNDEKEIKMNEETLQAEETQSAQDVETADNTAGETETEKVEEPTELEKANAQIEELKDKYLRTLAEFENYKKRTLKEKTELILNGGEKTITAILPILDDMERAMDNASKADSIEKLEEGWELI